MASPRKSPSQPPERQAKFGPRTETGKAPSSRNARQHGLSRLNLEDDVSLDALASAITAVLMQQQSTSTVHELVRANLWLNQIREVRHAMLAALLECPCPKQMKRLAGLERYERPVRTAQRPVLRRQLKEGQAARKLGRRFIELRTCR
ncbi:hypothetical protein [Bradyrhizobium sp. 15]|uniref:hypothetical protein n=1 Tax=Bradyrhizobium sp. 15 TaxID=2782633 RepID=UPI001FFAEE1D|nr:hypothetical protein [Bradyrhizobium sp. 15]MCK1434966.1 hypothetical protein [Bradyrhizobium sp. 15]